MSEVATTRMSSRGQVVIPEAVRERLGLRAGAEFAVFGDGDILVLKVIHPPPRAEFDGLIGRAEAAAREAGLTRADISRAGKEVRGGR